MKFEPQSVDEILSVLTALEVEWQDDTSRRVINVLDGFSQKPSYDRTDILELLTENFDDGILIARLFLGLSKDPMVATLNEILGPGGTGVSRFKTDPESFLDAFVSLGLLDTMAATVNREAVWSDVLVERLRSGRGSAISGQRRGRALEDFVAGIVSEIFGEHYEERCNFIGQRQRTAKCDFAIPKKDEPRIIIESKAYNATGSKMTDIIGDIAKIIAAKRHDMVFILVTDGLSWRQRTSDLSKIVEHQNNGEIYRIYTTQMAEQLREDLVTIKNEHGLDG